LGQCQGCESHLAPPTPNLGLPKTPSVSRCKASARSVGAEGSARRQLSLLSSPIHTCGFASLLFVFGRVIAAVFGRVIAAPLQDVVDGHELVAGVIGRRSRRSPPRAILPRLLAVMNAGAYSAPNTYRIGLRCSPSAVAFSESRRVGSRTPGSSEPVRYIAAWDAPRSTVCSQSGRSPAWARPGANRSRETSCAGS
jgi:hypothetical protein